VVRDELGLCLPGLRAALEAPPCLDCRRLVECYFSLMSNSITHAHVPCPDTVPRPSDLMHAYIVSLLSPTVTMLQSMLLVNFSTFRPFYTGDALVGERELLPPPTDLSSSDDEG
jgi:hypothetical protein